MAPLTRDFLSAGSVGEKVARLSDLLSRSSVVAGSEDDGSSHLARRQAQMVSIPNTYTDITDSPGIVVAILLGTVCGFVLLIWLIALVFNRRNPFPPGDTGTVVSSSETAPSFGAFSRSRRKRHSRPQVAEVRRGGPRASRASMEQARDEDELAYDEDDYDSPPHSPRPGPRRSSGYRTVNPRRYGG